MTPTPSPWWQNGIIYQIYPRSFADSNGDGVGDLNGITAHLDYLTGLGVDAIWLSPIYPSPDVDFGYDVSDYTAIHPLYGTLADFDRLLAAAHARGIHVVLDLVLNHTSDQHPWFQAALSSRDDEHRSWYLWRDPKPDGGPPNNWQAVFGGGGWQFDPASGQYYFHMFYPQQPDLNWRNPAAHQALLDVFRFWLARGVDGFRLDVFNAFYKHADLPDNPPAFGLRAFDRQQHRYDIDQPEMLPLLAEIRQLLDACPEEKYAVGETFLGNPERAAHYCGPNRLHATFNFEFLKCRWRPSQFLHAIQRWEHALEPEAWPTYVLNNHDTPRSASRYAQGEDDERLKVAAMLLLTQRGTPFLYYGEEIGQRDIPITRSQIRDPIGKRYWPFFIGRDGCRAPMQWDASPNAGFSPAPPWLPVHRDYTQRNVQAQQSDPNSLYHFYRRLIQLRREYPALRQGLFLPLTYEPRLLLAYLRQTSEQTVLVALNFGRFKRRLVLGPQLARAPWKLLLSNRRTQLAPLQSGLLPLAPNEACLLVLDSPLPTH